MGGIGVKPAQSGGPVEGRVQGYRASRSRQRAANPRQPPGWFDTPMHRERFTRPSPWVVTGLFVASGAVHLIRPGVFESMIPSALPRPREIVYASGVAELVCAAGLIAKAPWAGPASAAVLAGVWPGNVQFALTATAKVREGGANPRDVAVAAVAWARLPLQIPMLRAALSTRRAR
jgi:uncharacterized membrane protein